MLTPTDAATMTSTLAASLPDVATIMRAKLTADAMGGARQTWVVLASNVPCRLSPSMSRVGDEAISGGAVVSSADWTITLPKGQDVTPSDRIRVGSRTFEVTVARARSWELARRVQCSEVV